MKAAVISPLSFASVTWYWPWSVARTTGISKENSVSPLVKTIRLDSRSSGLPLRFHAAGNRQRSSRLDTERFQAFGEILPVMGVEPESLQSNFTLLPSSVLILWGNWTKKGSSGSSSLAENGRRNDFNVDHRRTESYLEQWSNRMMIADSMLIYSSVKLRRLLNLQETWKSHMDNPFCCSGGQSLDLHFSHH